MGVPMLLLCYAVVLATAGTALLRRAGWALRAPRPAILAWFALSASTIASVLLAVLSVALEATRGGVARPCDAPARWSCSPAAGGVPALVALLIVLLIGLRVGWCMAKVYVATRRQRQKQRDSLAVLGRADDRLGVTVVEHAAPAAYCLPGRVVITTAAVDALDEEGLAGHRS